MCVSHLSRVAAVLLIALTASAAGAWPHRRDQKVRVRFLATSTLVRGTWGQNEDTYLVRLTLPKQSEAILVRLIDAYPNEWPPLSREVLISDAGAVLRVRRDAACDRNFGQILLRAAPGDPMAILPVRLSYRLPFDLAPASGMVVQCYRVVRQ